MKKLIRNSLIASVVAVAGAAGFAGEAKAQFGPDASSQPSDVEVNFTGEVGNLCEITKVKDGKMGLTDNRPQEFLSSRPDESSEGELGEIEVNCNESGEISVTAPTPISADAQALVNTGVEYNPNVQIFNSGTQFADSTLVTSEGRAFQTTNKPPETLTLNGTPQTLYVHMFIYTDNPTPAGNYQYSTTVTITPQ